MLVRYELTPADHLAWFDYHTAYVAGPWPARLPLLGPALLERRRERFARDIAAAASAAALGERSVELSVAGVREFSSSFDFSTAWPDLAFAALTPEHVFFAHPSMNAHIVPLRSFGSDAARESFVAFATSHAPSFRNHRNA
jgi:hypothetical protein